MNLEKFASLYAGKLLLRREFQMEESMFETLLEKDYIKKVPGVQKRFGMMICNRCFNQERKYFGVLPDQIHYCRKCIMMGRVSEREHLYYWAGTQSKVESVQQSCQWAGELTSFQLKASDAIIDTIQYKNKLLISAVCGAGKTEMLYKGIELAVSQNMKLCIATPRTDVVRELAPRLRRDFPKIRSAALYGDSTEVDNGAHLVIATTHQLLRYREAFEVIIVDEVDAFPYHKDKSLPQAVKRAAKSAHAMIYLTATPRPNLKLQSALKLIPTVSIPLRFHGHPLPVPAFKHVRKLEKQLQSNQLPQAVLEWIKSRNGRRYLLFAPTIEAATQLSEQLDQTPYVFAESPKRKELIQQFRNKNIDALITTTILERGVTFPSIDVAVIQADHHVFDEAALVQIAGRAGRSATDPSGDVTFFYETKTNAMVQAKQYTLMKNKEAKEYMN